MRGMGGGDRGTSGGQVGEQVGEKVGGTGGDTREKRGRETRGMGGINRGTGGRGQVGGDRWEGTGGATGGETRWGNTCPPTWSVDSGSPYCVRLDTSTNSPQNCSPLYRTHNMLHLTFMSVNTLEWLGSSSMTLSK